MNIVNQITFTGGRTLMYYYDPKIGRFIHQAEVSSLNPSGIDGCLGFFGSSGLGLSFLKPYADGLSKFGKL